MASADEYAGWIVKNADKKGTPDFDTVAQAYEQAKGEEVTAAPKAPRSPGLDFSLNMDKVKAVGQGIGDTVAGAVRGAGSIGSTILYPWDKAQDLYYGDRGKNLSSLISGKEKPSRNEERRAAIDGGLRELGANPDSAMYGVGKFGAEIAGTAGAGGVLANGASKIPALTKALPGLAQALRTGGFRTGLPAAPLLSRAGAAAMGTRVVGGALPAAAMQTAMDGGFENTGMAAGLGAALPVGFKVAGETGMLVADKVIKPAARRLMQSALKPTIKQLKTGDARVAVDTLLDYGINPNQRGVEKLRGVIDDINTDITGRVANSRATVNKHAVSSYLDDVRNKFGNQVSPTSDMNAIQAIGDDFMSQPSLPGNNIPVQLAQKLKTGTYKALSGKYGEAGSAATEAQKALARGLKDEIGFSVPGISQLNAEEARLLKTLGVAERRALMELNKNPVGLAALAGNPVGFMAFMADRSAAFKALSARMINQAAKAPKYIEPAGNKLLANPAARGGLLTIQADQ